MPLPEMSLVFSHFARSALGHKRRTVVC